MIWRVCVRRSPERTNRKTRVESSITERSSTEPIFSNKFPSYRFQHVQLTHQASWKPEVSSHTVISEILLRPQITSKNEVYRFEFWTDFKALDFSLPGAWLKPVRWQFVAKSRVGAGAVRNRAFHPCRTQTSNINSFKSLKFVVFTHKDYHKQHFR